MASLDLGAISIHNLQILASYRRTKIINKGRYILHLSGHILTHITVFMAIYLSQSAKSGRLKDKNNYKIKEDIINIQVLIYKTIDQY